MKRLLAVSVFFAPVAGVLAAGEGGASADRSPGQVEARVDTSKLVPLTDMGSDQYQGFEGGLYPGGRNERPHGHEAAGRALAAQVRPLDASGRPSADGKVVMLATGFSNTLQVFKGFMEVAKGDAEMNPRVVLVNGAVGGVPASEAQKEDGKGPRGMRYWDEVDQRLKDAGVTARQVQVVWLKETNPVPHRGGFPAYTRELEGQLEKIVQLLRRRFPNLKMVYLSSRSWGGWARVPPGRPQQKEPGNSEPYSYETGFAVKWLIEKQLKSDPDLNYDPNRGAVKAPWLSWGPYLWANGSTKRKDGFAFALDDFQEADRMHHSPQGMRKLGARLLQFFQTDATTEGWFLRR